MVVRLMSRREGSVFRVLNQPRRGLSFMGGTLPPGVTLTRASSGTRFNSAGVLVTETTDVARFTYNPVTLAPEGLLVEPARTNYALRSATFSDAVWADGGTASKTSSTATGPDGVSQTIWRYGFNSVTAGNLSLFYQNTTLAESVGDVAWSIFAQRASGGTQVGLSAQTAGGSPGVGSAFGGIVAPGAAWGRVNTAGNFSAPSGNVGVTVGFDGRAPLSQTGIAAITIDVWGAQAEAGVGASTYIPTAGATATRAADVVTVALADGTYDIDIVRLSGTTNLTGQVVSGGYTVPTSISPLQLIFPRRTA